METFILEMVRDEIWGLEIELGGFMKLEGCVKLRNQFHVSGHLSSEKTFLADGIYQFQNTCFDMEGFESWIRNRFTYDNR